MAKSIKFIEKVIVPEKVYQQLPKINAKCPECDHIFNLGIPDEKDRTYSISLLIRQALVGHNAAVTKYSKTKAMVEGKLTDVDAPGMDWIKIGERQRIYEKIRMAEDADVPGVILEDSEFRQVFDAVSALTPPVALLEYIGGMLMSIHAGKDTDGTEFDTPTAKVIEVEE